MSATHPGDPSGTLAAHERLAAAVERAERAEQRAWLAEQLAEAKAEILALTRQQRDDAQARAKSYLGLVEDLREQRDEAREWEGVAQDACLEIERHELEVKRLTELARDLSDTSRVQLASIESTTAQLKSSRAEVERLGLLVEVLRRDLGTAQVRAREHEIEVERLTKLKVSEGLIGQSSRPLLPLDPARHYSAPPTVPAFDATNTEPDEESTRG